MSAFDPVSWETVEATIGPPTPEVTDFVDDLADEVYDEAPYDAVKTIHDALYEADLERSVSSLGEPFVTAYLLEKRGVLDPGATDEYRSIVDRRPTDERLERLFWERERTLWWIGIVSGVHPDLVTYWFYEADIPLMERNFGASSMQRIREFRRSREG